MAAALIVVDVQEDFCPPVSVSFDLLFIIQRLRE